MKQPREQSSKKPVSGVREIPGLASSKSTLYLDPRFDTARGKADLTQVRRNYAFLDQYRENELEQLRADRKRARDPKQIEQIEKAIQSQASRLETLKRRDEEVDILRNLKNKKISRRKKRELVLSERFSKMTSKESARAVEKRRRKVAQKQKKLLPERRE